MTKKNNPVCTCKKDASARTVVLDCGCQVLLCDWGVACSWTALSVASELLTISAKPILHAKREKDVLHFGRIDE